MHTPALQYTAPAEKTSNTLYISIMAENKGKQASPVQKVNKTNPEAH